MKLVDKGKQIKFNWLQNLSQVNGDNLNVTH